MNNNNFEANKKLMEQNNQKLSWGCLEVLYFGFFCFEPKILPNIQPPETCEVPFTQITAIYALLILVIMIPLRLVFTRQKNNDAGTVSRFYAVIVVLHMFLCLGWFIYALIELKNSDASCWDPFTWQYLNYYLILLITLGPAMTLGLGIVLAILCLPCIGKELCMIAMDEKKREEMGERVIQGLAKRTFNPE